MIQYKDITESIIVGSYPQGPEDFQQLALCEGVRGLLSLQSDEDLAARGLDWHRLWTAAMRAGIEARRVPIADVSRRDLRRHLGDAVDELHALTQLYDRVYVHCTAGLNRSPTVVIAYLATHGGLDIDEAIQLVTTRHRCLPYTDLARAWVQSR